MAPPGFCGRQCVTRCPIFSLGLGAVSLSVAQMRAVIEDERCVDFDHMLFLLDSLFQFSKAQFKKKKIEFNSKHLNLETCNDFSSATIAEFKCKSQTLIYKLSTFTADRGL